MRNDDQRLQRLLNLQRDAHGMLCEDYTVLSRRGEEVVVQGQAVSYLRESLKETYGYTRLPSAGRWDDFVTDELGLRIVRGRNHRGQKCNVAVAHDAI